MKMKKAASVFLALSLTLGVCACGSEPDNSKASAPEGSSGEASSEQASEEKSSESEGAAGADNQVKLRIAIGKHSADVSDNNDFTKYKPMLQKAADELGYDIEWMPVLEGGAEADRMSTMLAGDLPDVFWGLLSENQIIDNSGLFVTLEDKLEEFAPNVYALYEDGVDGWRDFLTYPDGHIYGMMGNTLVSPNNAVQGTMWINKKWLDQLELEIPTTMAELEEVLSAFRDNDCDGDGDTSNEIPLDWCQKHYAAKYNELAQCFGFPLNGGFYDIVDGQIVSIVDTEEYRGFLEEYHRLAAEGLVNVEGATQTEEQYNSNLSSGKVGVFWGWAPYTYMSEEEMKEQYVPLPPISADGTTFRVHPNLNNANRNCYVITTACQNVEAAMKLWDYLSVDETTSFSTAFGEEGLIWEFVDGVPTNRTYTAEEATEMGYGEIASNAGTSTFAATVGLPNCGPLMLTARENPSGTNGGIRWEAVKDYVQYYMDETMPKLIIPAEANEEFSFATDGLADYINTFACESILNGVTDEGWNSYISGLAQHGYDFYLEFQQKHLDNNF
ncbi:extracellular solute-binding protein [uncultured Acetatifactor sp.]|uniref:extracellular solute-binding protein n=1 Tax=uncultured Acetatifactor sp. TaxID=1671927 RepID=UPI0026298044|nr:extracellular solute-binding protein [uncultured Acetatifactor sp.]